MIKLENLFVSYDGEYFAVDGVSLSIKKGEFLGIIGSSGSGKSSLLKSINKLVEPKRGQVIIDGEDITNYGEKSLRSVRRKIGMIFQDYNLIENSSVLENVLTGRLGYKSRLETLFGIFTEDEYALAQKALTNVGLEEKIFQRARDLSGGQKQRVSIAKALVQQPKLILADEPVASLDIQSSKVVMDYFKMVNYKKNMTIVINLHDVNLAREYCSRIIALHKGRIIFDGSAGDIDDELLEKIYL